MKKALVFFTVLFLLFTENAFAQLAATITTTDASCPNNGTITVTPSGGTSPYTYSINAGSTWQSSNQFNNLFPGTYAIRVKDAASAIFDVSNIIIKDAYTDMLPTATATNEVCYGSNTGSIKLSMPSGQGTPPYSYSISSDGGATFTTVSTNNTSTSYTFQNLAPGSYYVRVTDACNAYQTRQATLTAGANYNLNVNVWARPSSCGAMDYYVQPGLGTNYPHTYYAYDPSGNLVQTITVTGSQLVTVPGTTQLAFKFTLPNPAAYPGTYYTFKYTDACVQDPTNTRVKSNTPYLGNFNIILTNRNCGTDADIKVLEGWEMPVTVTITPTAGGTPIEKTITDEASRLAIFSGLTNGVNYTVKVTDGCNHSATQTFNMYTPTPKISTYFECGATIPGTANLTFGGLETGWQTPVTATINSGPTSFYSADIGKTFTASYPIPSSNSTTDYAVRFMNLAPGTYNITFTDGCQTKTIDVVIQDHIYSVNLTPVIVSGCTGSRKIVSTATASCNGSNVAITADIKKGTAESVYSNGQNTPFTLSNLANDVYNIYYYSQYNSTDTRYVFRATSADLYNGKLLLKKETVQVTDPPSNPRLSQALSAQCSDGSISIKLIPEATTATITGYQIQNPDGSYGTLQSSPIFTISGYGTYSFRIVDECLNAGVSAVNVSPNPAPIVKNNGNTCLSSGDINLYIDALPSNATAVWTKPDGTTVNGTQLLIPASTTGVNATGSYSVKVTYTVGSCTEVKETTFSLSSGCINLPVNWGSFSAIIKNGMLLVNWSTLKEINNNYFEVQVSTDGNTWKTIGKMKSTATDGNSDSEIKYEYQYSLANMAALFGLPALLGLLAFSIKRKNKYIISLLITAIFAGSIFIGCRKGRDNDIADANTKVWVRIVQFDNDGSQKTTNVIQAVRE